MQQVADHAGVSLKSVSNVVRGYQHVSAALRERVQASIDELGFRPNIRGRSLASGRSGMVAFALPDLRRPYFAELAHTFSRCAAARGLRLLLDETGGTTDGERSALLHQEVGLVDGVLFHPQALTPAELDALSAEPPVVFLGEEPQAPQADQVMIDNVQAARDAAQYLADSGRRRIGFLGHEADVLSRTSQLRLEGFHLGLDSAGLPQEPARLIPRVGGDATAAEQALGSALDAGLDADALLCRDDLTAIGALRALSLRGLKAPQDMALIGWDGIELGQSIVPTLTSITPDTNDLATRALDMLIERIDGASGPGRTELAQYYLHRGESAPPLDD